MADEPYWHKDYRNCPECKSALSEETFQLSIKSARHYCCSTECTNKQYLRSHACCMEAEVNPCVCAYSFTCKVHGSMHVGTHD